MHRLVSFLIWPLLLLAQNHLLITEVYIPPTAEMEQAFIEITNPTNQAIDLDSVYLANYNTYYRIVENAFPNTNNYFNVQFPAFTIEAHQVITVALKGEGYFLAFGKQADFEIIDTDEQIPNMKTVQMGSNPMLETAKGMMILFYWNGQSDLVQDVDYLPWGLLPFNATWMDKSGVAIDGPDTDTLSTTYFNDLATNQQKAISNIPAGQSLQRKNLIETDEISSGGNGLTGHNEASENFQLSFKTAKPTPAVFSLIPGDGSGQVSVSPDTVETATTFDLTLNFSTEEDYLVNTIRVTLPDEFTWSQSSDDVQLTGTAFTSAMVAVDQNQILIHLAQLTTDQPGKLLIKNVQAPLNHGIYSIQIETATTDGHLMPIAIFPTIFVQKRLTIADIQNNLSLYEGKRVTIEAVVSIGVNILRTDRCDAYVQDESGRGINLNDFSTNFPELERGNRLKITGTVTEYVNSGTGDATTELTDFSLQLLSTNNAIPAVSYFTCAQANNIDLEGTFIKTAGVITDKAEGIGGGTNMTINDGTTPLQLRIWDASGLDLSSFNVGDTIVVRGLIDSYRKAAQVVVAYQEDIQKGSIPKTVAGSGLVSVQPDSVGKAENIDLHFTLQGSSKDTLSQCSITIPEEWTWSALKENIQLLDAFSTAEVTIIDREILIKNFIVTNSNSGSLTLMNLQSPNADTVSVFTFKTGGLSTGLLEVEASPRVIVGKGTNRTFISIEEARQLPVGSKITIKGVITIGTGILHTNFTDAYVQDESGYGLNIYRGGGVDAALKRGRLVILSGELAEYQGKKEIVNYTATILKNEAPIPGIRTLSTYEASTTVYEGSFVEIKGLISGIQTTGGGTNIYVNDGSGQVTVRVWDTAGLDLSGFEVGDYVQVRGVVSIYQNAGQILLGYQEDITVPPIPEGNVFLKVPNHPFVPDQGEKLPIEYQAGNKSSHVTLRIFDLAGRLIATLYDGDGLPFPVKREWDGTDQLGEWVGLGTYLCHLEVVNNDTGKRTVKIAPIVVGTVLK